MTARKKMNSNKKLGVAIRELDRYQYRMIDRLNEGRRTNGVIDKYATEGTMAMARSCQEHTFPSLDTLVSPSRTPKENSRGKTYIEKRRAPPTSIRTPFTSKEVDPLTGGPEEEGYKDEYRLEEVELAAGGM